MGDIRTGTGDLTLSRDLLLKMREAAKDGKITKEEKDELKKVAADGGTSQAEAAALESIGVSDAPEEFRTTSAAVKENISALQKLESHTTDASDVDFAKLKLITTEKTGGVWGSKKTTHGIRLDESSAGKTLDQAINSIKTSQGVAGTALYGSINKDADKQIILGNLRTSMFPDYALTALQGEFDKAGIANSLREEDAKAKLIEEGEDPSKEGFAEKVKARAATMPAIATDDPRVDKRLTELVNDRILDKLSNEDPEVLRKTLVSLGYKAAGDSNFNPKTQLHSLFLNQTDPAKLQEALVKITNKLIPEKANAEFDKLSTNLANVKTKGEMPYLNMDMFKGCSKDVMRALVDCTATDMSKGDLERMQSGIKRDIADQKFNTPGTLTEMNKQLEGAQAKAVGNLGKMVLEGKNFIAAFKELKEQAKNNPELQKQYDEFMSKFDVAEIERMESDLAKLEEIHASGGPVDTKTAQMMNQMLGRMQVICEMSDLETQASSTKQKSALEKEIADLEGQLATASEPDKAGLQTKLDKAKVDLQGLKITPGFEKLATAYNNLYWSSGDVLTGADSSIRQAIELQQRTQSELGIIENEIDKALTAPNLTPEMTATLTLQKEAIADAKACLAAGKVISFRAQDVMTDDQFTLISSLEPSPPSDKAIKELLKCDDATALMFASAYKKSMEKEKAFGSVLKTLDKVASQRSTNEFLQGSGELLKQFSSFGSSFGLMLPGFGMFGSLSPSLTGASSMFGIPPLDPGSALGTPKPDLTVDVSQTLLSTNQATLVSDAQSIVKAKVDALNKPEQASLKAELTKSLETAQKMLADPSVPADVKKFINDTLQASAKGENLNDLIKFTLLASTYRENTNKGLSTSDFASLLSAGAQALQVPTVTPVTYLESIAKAAQNDTGYRTAQAKLVADKLLHDPYISADSKAYLKACLAAPDGDPKKADLLFLTELFTKENKTADKQHTCVNQAVAILKGNTGSRVAGPDGSLAAPYAAVEAQLDKNVRSTSEYKAQKKHKDDLRAKGIGLDETEQNSVASKELEAMSQADKLAQDADKAEAALKLALDATGKPGDSNGVSTNQKLEAFFAQHPEFGYDKAKFPDMTSFLMTLSPAQSQSLLDQLESSVSGVGSSQSGKTKGNEVAEGAGDTNALSPGQFNALKTLMDQQIIPMQKSRDENLGKLTAQRLDLQTKRTTALSDLEKQGFGPDTPLYKATAAMYDKTLAQMDIMIGAVGKMEPIPKETRDQFCRDLLLLNGSAAIYGSGNADTIKAYHDMLISKYSTDPPQELTTKDMSQFILQHFQEKIPGKVDPNGAPLTKGSQLLIDIARQSDDVDNLSDQLAIFQANMAQANNVLSGESPTEEVTPVVPVANDAAGGGSSETVATDTVPVVQPMNVVNGDHSGGGSRYQFLVMDDHSVDGGGGSTPVNGGKGQASPSSGYVAAIVDFAKSYVAASPEQQSKMLGLMKSNTASMLDSITKSVSTSTDFTKSLESTNSQFSPDFIKKLQAENDKQDVNDFKAEQAAAEEMGAVIDEKTSAKIKAANDLAQSLDLTAVVGGKDAGDLAAEFAKIIGEADFAQRQILLKALAKKLVDAFINKKYKDKLDKANKEQMEALQKIAARMQQSTQILLESSLKAAIASSSDPKQQAVAASSMFKTHMGATGLQ